MKKVYITGIAGLLGYAIARKLLEKYRVCGVDIVKVDMPDCDVENFDLTNFEELENSIKNQKPDIVIHTAAAVNVDECEINKDYADLLNSKLTENISFICKERDIKLIYISTDAVYDGEKDGLYTENDEPNPINYYGVTKLRGENSVKQVDNSLILRTNIYGINVQNKKSFGEWIVSALSDGQTLNMFTDIKFSPILVNELAEVIDKCLDIDLSGLYHACGTGCISKYDFGVLIKEIFEINTGQIIKATSDCVNFKAKRSKNMGMLNARLSNKLDIHISTPEESVRRFKEIYY